MSDATSTSVRDRILYPAAAIACYALLLDLAVESIVNGSRLRWWVGGMVLAFAILTAIGWRRVSWPFRAASGLLALLLLLAFVALRPGGLEDGIMLAGQPPGVVFSLVTAVAIASAGVALVRSRRLPNVLKGLFAVLAVYGVGTFAWGIARSATYPGVLHGVGLPTWLPGWLDGALLGALVVLPAALLLLMGHGIRRVRGPELRPWLVQVLSLALIIGIVGAGLRGPGSSAGDELVAATPAAFPDGAPAPVSSRSSGADTVSSRFGAVLSAATAAVMQVPRESFDIEARVAKLGRDPATLLAWVRDSTALVPYRGMLRGAVGTLMDRSGNSLDRSLLLFALLRAAGHEVRLMRGTLEPTQARELLRGPEPRVRPRLALHGSALPPGALGPVARALGTDAASLASVVDEEQQQRLKVFRDRREQAERQADAIVRAVRSYRSPDAGIEEAAAALADHWWTEVRSGSQWVSLDPTLTPQQRAAVRPSGEAPLIPEQTADIDSSLHHHVRLRAVITAWDDGALRDTTVLDQRLLPAELLESRVTFRIIPTGAVDSTTLGRGSVADLDRLLLQQKEWMAVLEVDDRVTGSNAFDEHGNLTDTTLPGWAEGARRLGGRIGNLLSGSEPNSRAPTSEAQLVGLRLEFEFHSPGRPVHRATRRILELVGSDAAMSNQVPAPDMTERRKLERALALMSSTSLLPLVGRVTPEFIEHAAAARLAASAPVLERLADPGTGLSSYELLRGATALDLLSGSLYEVALSRWLLADDGIVQDRANLIAEHSGLRLDARGSPAGFRSIDIVGNEVTVLAAGTDAFRDRVRQGVLDTHAESLTDPDATPNAAQTFGSSRAPAEEWDVLARPDATELERLPVPARAAIRRELQRGYVALVAPHASYATSPIWWRIDPRTGSVLGFDERGWGASGTEYTITKADMEEYAKSTYFLAVFIKASYGLYECTGGGTTVLTSAQNATCAASFLCTVTLGATPSSMFIKTLFLMLCTGATRALPSL